jgi:hypothetical protein
MPWLKSPKAGKPCQLKKSNLSPHKLGLQRLRPRHFMVTVISLLPLELRLLPSKDMLEKLLSTIAQLGHLSHSLSWHLTEVASRRERTSPSGASRIRSKLECLQILLRLHQRVRLWLLRWILRLPRDNHLILGGQKTQGLPGPLC